MGGKQLRPTQFSMTFEPLCDVGACSLSSDYIASTSIKIPAITAQKVGGGGAMPPFLKKWRGDRPPCSPFSYPSAFCLPFSLYCHQGPPMQCPQQFLLIVLDDFRFSTCYFPNHISPSLHHHPVRFVIKGASFSEVLSDSEDMTYN